MFFSDIIFFDFDIFGEIVIEDWVYIGAHSLIMPGVTIGDGCVIGAHSIVKNDIPEASIAVGSPAKVVKYYSFEDKKWVKIICKI